MLGAVAITTASALPHDASAGTSLEGCYVDSYGVEVVIASPPCQHFAGYWPTPIARYRKIGQPIPIQGTLRFSASH